MIKPDDFSESGSFLKVEPTEVADEIITQEMNYRKDTNQLLSGTGSVTPLGVIKC